MPLDEVIKKLGTKRLKNILHISNRDKYVYISNPKAACSTIKLYLSRCEKKDPYFMPQDLHLRRYLPFNVPKKMNKEELEKLLNGTLFVFTFVRHPFKRIISAYTEKIVGNKIQKREILNLLNKNMEDLEQEISFNEFVIAILSQKSEILNPHWRPQVYNLYPDIINYDFIGHLETFQQDIDFVRKHLKLPDYPITQQNATSTSINLTTLLTPINRFKLARLYAKDFMIFGYRPKGVEWLGVILGHTFKHVSNSK